MVITRTPFLDGLSHLANTTQYGLSTLAESSKAYPERERGSLVWYSTSHAFSNILTFASRLCNANGCGGLEKPGQSTWIGGLVHNGGCTDGARCFGGITAVGKLLDGVDVSNTKNVKGILLVLEIR